MWENVEERERLSEKGKYCWRKGKECQRKGKNVGKRKNVRERERML